MNAECAFHPGQPSIFICSRCGSFACEACRREGPGREPSCERCLRPTAREPLPWDRADARGSPFLATCWALLRAPRQTLALTLPLPIARGSLRFALQACAVYFIALSLLYNVKPATHGVQPPAPLTFFLDMVDWGSRPSRAILLMLGAFGVLPWVDWLVLRGRRASFRACLRATALACAPLISSVAYAGLGALLLVTWHPSRLWSICAGALPLWYLLLWLWCGTLRAHALQSFFSLAWWRAWLLAFAGPLTVGGLFMALARVRL